MATTYEKISDTELEATDKDIINKTQLLKELTEAEQGKNYYTKAIENGYENVRLVDDTCIDNPSEWVLWGDRLETQEEADKRSAKNKKVKEKTEATKIANAKKALEALEKAISLLPKNQQIELMDEIAKKHKFSAIVDKLG